MKEAIGLILLGAIAVLCVQHFGWWPVLRTVLLVGGGGAVGAMIVATIVMDGFRR